MVSAVLLVLTLVCAVVRPFGWPEAVVAVPAAALLIATGAVPLRDAGTVAQQLGPVIGFLAAVLVLAELCDDDGLFTACGAWMGRAAAGSPVRLLGWVFVIASVTTAVLSLDATVVLLTPVVFATASRAGVRAKPHAYACAHLSNSASLLLPVSNLTNLLAFAAAGIGFTKFAALMALPWLAAIGVEYVALRLFFASDLRVGVGAAPGGESPPTPVFTLALVALTLVGFALASAAGINPAWVAAAGALVLAVRALRRRQTTVAGLVGAASPSFLAFVLSLGIVVRALVDHGLAGALDHLIPSGTSLPALLALAGLAALLANLINNLPAVLVLLPPAAPHGVGAVLAVLIGVNVSPNLTYAGSLATLLWRRIVHAHGKEVDLGEFSRLAVLTVPAALFVATVALWVALRLIGG